jgi:hypothetical protein
MDLKRVNQAIVVLSVMAAILLGSGLIIEEFGVSLELWGYTHVHGPLYAAAIGVFVPVILLSIYSRSLRDKAIAQVAALNNWQVKQNLGQTGLVFGDSKSLGSADTSDLPLLRNATQLRNALVDKHGFPHVIGVKTGSGKHSVMQTVYCFQNQFDSPVFQIHKEGGLSKLGQMLASAVGADKDIDFDEDKEFSDSFVLKGADEEAIRALFVGSLRQYFSNQSTAQDWLIESGQAVTIFYRSGKLAAPEVIVGERNECLAIQKKLDSYRQRI